MQKVNGHVHNQASLPLGKELRYHLSRRECGPQSRFGYGGDEKKFASAGNRTSVVHHVA
jgi:hypothetical protein